MKVENNNIPAIGVYFLFKNRYGYNGKYGIVRNYVSSKNGKLRTEKGYSRHACSLFRIVRKLKYPVNTEHHSNYTPKKYDTPTNIGIKWQMDVKVVPKQCYVG